MFFATTKVPSRSPRLPRISPQLHHVFTTRKTVEIAKPPEKTPNPPHRIFFCKDRRIEEWESAEKTLWTAFKAMI
jgi:hypothetical protein